MLLWNKQTRVWSAGMCIASHWYCGRGNCSPFTFSGVIRVKMIVFGFFLNARALKNWNWYHRDTMRHLIVFMTVLNVNALPLDPQFVSQLHVNLKFGRFSGIIWPLLDLSAVSQFVFQCILTSLFMFYLTFTFFLSSHPRGSGSIIPTPMHGVT